MKNKERIYDTLVQLLATDNAAAGGITARQIAAELGLQRNVVSQLLTQLCREERVYKTNSRPVYFFDRNTYKKRSGEALTTMPPQPGTGDDPFRQLIGYDASLRIAVDQCKSAAVYPPCGLPVLLTGETGVGKSLMAQLLFEYAQAKGSIDQTAPFIIFNCAEYANNPELLSANLFGYVKGAFTGADKTHPGLLEAADSGCIFLDEVHRLPPEGQEKLFLAMDKGLVRRLGETTEWHTVNIRFIFATTAVPENALIDTFLRRIPLIVRIPPLTERSLGERLQLIHHFYYREAQNLARTITVDKQVLNLLTSAKYSGNVGKILNIIKYSCAHAYHRVNPKTGRTLSVHIGNLPAGVISFSDKAKISPNDMTVNPAISEGASYSANFKEKQLSRLSSRFIHYLNRQATGGTSHTALTAEMADFLTGFTNILLSRHDNYRNNPAFFDYVNRLTESILVFLETNFGIRRQTDMALILSHFIHYLLENPPGQEADNSADSAALRILKEDFNKEYIVAAKVLELFAVNFGFMPNHEALIFLTVYMKSLSSHSHTGICGIIAAHGYSTASSIAGLANKMLGQYLFEAFDMPLELSPADLVDKMRKYLESISTDKGVILLVDMGSLEGLQAELAQYIDGDIGIINSITTQLVLSVGSKIKQNNETVAQIVKEAVAENTTYYQFFEAQTHKKQAILTTCSTGIGTAIHIKNLLTEMLNNDSMTTIAYDFHALKKNGANDPIFRQYDIQLIIGTVNPGIPHIPYLSLEDLIAGPDESAWGNSLQPVSGHKTPQDFNQAIVRTFSLQNVLNHLIILNPDRVIHQVEKAVSLFEMQSGLRLANSIKIALYVHSSILIERLIVKDPILSYEGIDELEANHQAFIQLINKSFAGIRQTYKVDIPVSEIGYLYDIIKSKMTEMAL